MTAKDEISRTLWHLHSGLITQVEAEKIIFPIIDDLITDAKARSEVKARAEGAEQEATKIVHCRECKFGKSLSNPTQADMRARRCHMWYATVLADGFCYAGDRAPVLAPTKEKP